MICREQNKYSIFIFAGAVMAGLGFGHGKGLGWLTNIIHTMMMKAMSLPHYHRRL